MFVILQNDRNNHKTIWLVADLSLSLSFTSLTFNSIKMQMHKPMNQHLPCQNRCSGATGGLGTAYHSDICDLISVLSGASVALPFVSCVLFCRPLFIFCPLSIGYCIVFVPFLLAIALSLSPFYWLLYCLCPLSIGYYIVCPNIHGF